MLSITISLLALLSSAVAQDVVSLLIPDTDTQNLVGEVIGISPTATTYVIQCAPGTDANDCGFASPFTLTEGPSTVAFTLTEALPADFTAAVNCVVTGSPITQALCAQSVGGSGASGIGSTTLQLNSTDITLFPVSITGTATGVGAATGSPSAVSTTGTGSGAATMSGTSTAGAGAASTGMTSTPTGTASGASAASPMPTSGAARTAVRMGEREMIAEVVDLLASGKAHVLRVNKGYGIGADGVQAMMGGGAGISWDDNFESVSFRSRMKGNEMFARSASVHPGILLVGNVLDLEIETRSTGQ
ncbi:hypothetical protein MMC26_007211 [Xylographa opegraphella]|nr:hypothetical protein [Xylographa opegraphella]